MIIKTVDIDIDESNGEVVKAYALQENHWWSVDYYLTPIILDAMLQFKKNSKHGVPARLAVDENGVKIPYDVARARWDEIIDKVILAFELMQKDNDGLIPEYYDRIDYKCDKELYTKQQNQIDEGLLLFGKYFRGFWD